MTTTTYQQAYFKIAWGKKVETKIGLSIKIKSQFEFHKPVAMYRLGSTDISSAPPPISTLSRRC